VKAEMRAIQNILETGEIIDVKKVGYRNEYVQTINLGGPKMEKKLCSYFGIEGLKYIMFY
jgi:hypothetical protein